MTITIRQQLAPEWFKINEADSVAFNIRPLNQLQLADVAKEIGINDFDRLAITSAGIRNALQYGLIEWRGVVGEDGKELPCTRQNQSMLPWEILSVLAFEIANRSRLTAEQKKS